MNFIPKYASPWFKFYIRPGLMHDGRPLTFWAKVKIWVWLRHAEYMMWREMRNAPDG